VIQVNDHNSLDQCLPIADHPVWSRTLPSAASWALNVVLRPNGLQTMEALQASSIRSATGRMCSCEARAIRCLCGTLSRYVHLSGCTGTKTWLRLKGNLSGLCSSPRFHPGIEQDWAVHSRRADDDSSGAHGNTRGTRQRLAPWWGCHLHWILRYAGIGGRPFSDDRGMEQFHRHSLEFRVCTERDMNNTFFSFFCGHALLCL
jgi:hypothetical protein